MSRLLLTVSAVIRTPLNIGWPPEPAPRLSSDPASDVFAFAPAGAAVVCAPKPELPLVPDCMREPKPLDDVDDGELLFRERRSALAVAYVPDPGAIWLSGLSSRPEDHPPMNIPVSTPTI